MKSKYIVQYARLRLTIASYFRSLSDRASIRSFGAFKPHLRGLLHQAVINDAFSPYGRGGSEYNTVKAGISCAVRKTV